MPLVKTIPLTQGKVALVDDEDYERVVCLNWHTRRKKHSSVYYAGHKPRGSQRNVLLHRLVINAPRGIQVDHKDGDGLNCQKYNLRLATQTQNMRNRPALRTSMSGLKGVRRLGRRWYARIKIHGRESYIGAFASAEDAARAYDAKAQELFGEFAFVNFPAMPGRLKVVKEKARRLKAHIGKGPRCPVAGFPSTAKCTMASFNFWGRNCWPPCGNKSPNLALLY